VRWSAPCSSYCSVSSRCSPRLSPRTELCLPRQTRHIERSGREVTLPPIRHVFVIVLETRTMLDLGRPPRIPYLAKVLPSEGTLLAMYYGIGHNSNAQLHRDDLGTAAEPGHPARLFDVRELPGRQALAGGIEPGNGCVYPKDVETIANQLAAKGLHLEGLRTGHGQHLVCGDRSVRSPEGRQCR